MTFKQTVVKNGTNHYVLPKTGNMKVEAHAFLSDDLFRSSEEQVWSQIANGASYEGVTGAYLMPDTHTGYGVPVGSVIVTDNTIIQGGSGYDISCFTGDTRVPLVDGRTMTLAELTALKGEFYVYSVTPEGRVTAGRAHSARKTRVDATLVEVELDNGSRVRCTPDHRWMRRNGEYVEARDLIPGESLMPLYRSYEREGYCDVKHPNDGSVERMYQVAFREIHGYVPAWPQIVHHDIFRDENPNPSKTNDDPRFLVEMEQQEHFRLHAKHARERALRGETGWKRLHELKPEQMSRMSSENMRRLHADPDFKLRHAKRMSEMNRICREAGKYEANWISAGQRGRSSLIAFNQSEAGRAQSRINGLANRGRKHSSETRHKLSKSRKGRVITTMKPCVFCGREFKAGAGLALHERKAHNNHKVVAVHILDIVEDVYCLTVEKYANFALEAGVFVHNCGVVYMRTNLKANNVKDKAARRLWLNEVEKRIATGAGRSRPKLMPKFEQSQADEILRYGAKALGISADLCERQFIEVPDDADLRKITKAYDAVLPQLGSVGGGNHFVEMQCDRDDGSVWIMVHCGSRGYGWQTANHYFYEGAKLRGLPSNRREDSWLHADEALGKEYWAHHNSAANFAVANRHIIVNGVREATQQVFKADLDVYYEISHNLVQEETLLLPNGTTKRGFVHRKGATRAFPAGHPDLVGTAWEKTGHPCLIPGSMYEGAAILFPKEGAVKSGCSVNHGSGRVLARGQAKRELADKQEDINKEMNTVLRTFGGTQVEGIMSNHRNIPLDECGACYKDLDAVLDVLEEEDIAKVANRLYPVANVKGSD